MPSNMTIDDRKFTRRIVIVTLLLVICAAIGFLNYPQADLQFERMFYDESTGFILNSSQFVNALRRIVIIGYGVWYTTIIVLLVVLVLAIRSSKPIVSWFYVKQLVYLIAASLTGPLLIANIILKNNWGRARPRQIIEFGGTQDFSPPLLISDQCATNCSFVSGEPSSMFMIFISLAFVLPAKRVPLLFTALIFGSLSGLMRMGQGGHFLSDVIFAGLFMTLTAAILYWLIFLSPFASRNQNH